jgi:hypothetical protein
MSSPTLSTIPQILCEIAGQIQLSDYDQTNGIVALHDYTWKLRASDDNQSTLLIIESIPEDLQNALAVL